MITTTLIPHLIFFNVAFSGEIHISFGVLQSVDSSFIVGHDEFVLVLENLQRHGKDSFSKETRTITAGHC